MTRRLLGLVLCTAACGDDRAAPDAALDAGRDAPIAATVSGTLVQLSSENGADGQPVTLATPPPVASTHLTVTLADQSTAAVPLAADGTFAIGLHAAGQAYRLEVAVDGAPAVEYQSAAPQLSLALFAAGRTPRAPGQEVVVKGVLGNWTDGDTAFLATTGLWTDTQAGFVTAPASGQTEPWGFEWTWSTARSLSGPLGLLDGAQHDALWLTAWRPHAAPAYTAIAAALADPAPTLTPGVLHELGADNAPVSLTTLAPACLHVVAPRATELARVTAALPDSYVAASDAWDIEVPAGSGLGPTGAQPIALGRDAGSGGDADLTASFGNPFGGARLLVSTGAHRARQILAASTDQPLFLNVGTQTWADVAAPADCAGSAALATAVPTVAIPSFPSMGGMVLDHDGQIVVLGGAPFTGGQTRSATPLTVSWTDAATGGADVFVVALVSLTSVNGATSATTTRTIFTTGHSVDVDPALFVGPMLIEVFAEQGFPHAATGDFRTVAFPFGTGVAISHVFAVEAPI